jgi:mRNA interferase MazF
MNRGDVYQVRFDPIEGSEQGGTRPAVIVTRNSINKYSPVILVTPFTDAQKVTRHYPTDVLVRAPEGGLTVDSVALCVQTRVISKSRLLYYRGTLSPSTMTRIERALRVTLNL